jgi:hypothetical protein
MTEKAAYPSLSRGHVCLGEGCRRCPAEELRARRNHPERACFRAEPHPWHTHINESPQGGCGLPEFCAGVPASEGGESRG